MTRILIPTKGADDWRQFLAKPEAQWRAGYSAYELAHCWEAAAGFPPAVRAALDRAPDAVLSDLELLLAVPEHQVPLPGGRRPSQTDLWVLARTSVGDVVSVTVEGKVAEPFDAIVGDWLAREGEPSDGKLERLDFLCTTLGLARDGVGHLRYQLLHRAASALIEAKRFGARHALMLVHSFSSDDEWFSDYTAFAEALGAEETPAIGTIVAVGPRAGISLYLGWVKDAPSVGA
jgi:hypothetical protein